MGKGVGIDPDKKRQTLPRIWLDQDVYTLALERMDNILTNHDKVVVAFSGGKDSTTVLNLALDVIHANPKHHRHLPLRCVFYDEEAIPYQTEEYVRRVAQRDDIALDWLCLPVRHRNACSRTSPFWWPWAPESQDRWCRPLPPEAITEWPGFPVWPPEARYTIPDANGLLTPPPHQTAMLMGIRAEESLIRSGAVSRKKVDNYILPYRDATNRGNLNKAYPIYDWSRLDVWHAAAKFGWDTNKAYDHLEMFGLTPYQQRCSPAFGEEPIQRLAIYAECFPEVWAKMVDRVPGVGAAYRYARTELYGFGEKPAKPADMPWPDFLTHYLAKFRPKEAGMIAQRVREEMLRHFRVTSDPILQDMYHPDTGMTWNFLLNLAMRGDFKSRRQAAFKLVRQDAGRDWWKYLTELQAVLDAGRGWELGHPHKLPAHAWELLPPPLNGIVVPAVMPPANPAPPQGVAPPYPPEVYEQMAAAQAAYQKAPSEPAWEA